MAAWPLPLASVVLRSVEILPAVRDERVDHSSPAVAHAPRPPPIYVYTGRVFPLYPIDALITFYIIYNVDAVLRCHQHSFSLQSFFSYYIISYILYIRIYRYGKSC